MKTFSIALAVASTVTLCTSYADNPKADKAFLAQLSPPVSIVTPPAPLVNGSDLCGAANPNDVIAGNGTFAFDNSAATDSAEPFTACVQPHKDVWFEWTAGATGNATMSLCGLAGNDTVIAAHTGAGCPAAAPIACNDDSCGLISQMSFAVTSGNVYMLRVGAFGTTLGQAGSFTMNVAPPPPPPVGSDDCATAYALPPGDQFVSFNSTLATTGTQGQAEIACQDYNTTNMQKNLWYTWTSTMGGTVSVTTCGLMTAPTANADTRIGIYDGAGCPTTPAIACNDDQGHMGPGAGSGALTCTAGGFNSTLTFVAVCGNSYTIQMAGFGATNNVGQFQITQSGSPCAPPGVGYCFGDDTGTHCPCSTTPPTGGSVPPGAAGNGCPNSLFPGGANLAGSGTPSLAGDTLSLNGSSMPNSSALYFQGTAPQAGGLGGVFGDGLRCAAGSVIRLGTKVNGAPPFAASSSSYPTGPDLPISVKGAVGAPGTRYYQCWYRNSALFCVANSTFNLTNGLNVTWVP